MEWKYSGRGSFSCRTRPLWIVESLGRDCVGLVGERERRPIERTNGGDEVCRSCNANYTGTYLLQVPDDHEEIDDGKTMQPGLVLQRRKMRGTK